jgi:hypothetical protein
MSLPRVGSMQICMGDVIPFRRPADDHNAARYLDVRLVSVERGYHGQFAGQFAHATAAWYVVRTCPCHDGELVTIPLRTREQAERARDLMLAVSEALRVRENRIRPNRRR